MKIKLFTDLMAWKKSHELVDYVVKIAKPNDVIAFLGSHGFRNMIESVVSVILSR